MIYEVVFMNKIFAPSKTLIDIPMYIFLPEF